MKSKKQKNDPKSLITSFLEGKKILIVDPSVGIRSTISNIFKDLGASTFNLAQASNHATAVNLIHQVRPQIIICDYDLGTESGLQLIRLRNGLMAGATGLFSIVITANSRETAIVEAAEEDIDCYILKPFTAASFQTYVARIILDRSQPGRYGHALEEGKARLSADDFASAEKSFQEAIGLSSNPALAHFYLGHIRILKRDVEGAKSHFLSGLESDPHHFRCLTGLFELYLQNNQKFEAYETAKRMLAVFPVSPHRLEDILRLAVSIGRFDEIIPLYRYYLETEYRHPQLVKAMIAALLVSGKYFIGLKQTERALDHFRKAMISSGRSMATFREIITALVKSGLTAEATDFSKELPQNQKADPEYRSLDYMIVDQLKEPIEVINAGMKLLTEKISHPSIYKILIHRYLEIGKAEQAELLATEASRLWPEEKTVFEESLRQKEQPPRAQS